MLVFSLIKKYYMHVSKHILSIKGKQLWSRVLGTQIEVNFLIMITIFYLTNRFPRNKNRLVKHMLNPTVLSKSETSTRFVLRPLWFILPIDESLVFCVTVYVIKRSNKSACTHTYARRTVSYSDFFQITYYYGAHGLLTLNSF